MRDSQFPSALATLGALARFTLLPALLVSTAAGLDTATPFGMYLGDLSQLAPASAALQYRPWDPPDPATGMESGVFELTRFDVDPNSRQPRGQLQLSIQVRRWSKPNPFRKQNFTWTEERQQAGRGYHAKIVTWAGNVELLLSMNVDGTLVGTEPDPRRLLEEMLALLPRQPLADAGVEVTPRAAPEPAAVGLIPASSRLPARIVALANPPGRPVTFSVPDSAPATLETSTASGRSVDVIADRTGRAEVRFRYAPEQPAPLAAPLSVPVLVVNDLGFRRADVKVGLGLAFDRIRAVPGEKYRYAPDAPFPLLLSVKSTFHPGLRIGAYLHAAKEAKVWGDAVPGLLLETRWANRPPDAAVEHQAYRGSAEIWASLAAGEDNYLVANIEPWFRTPKSYLPAVILKARGHHVFQVSGRTAVLDATTKRLLEELRDDPLVVPGGLVLLSTEEPESALQSLACSFQAQTRVQALMLETARKMPMGYGTAFDYLTAGTDLLCGLLKEEYEASFLGLANFLGGKYLDHLETPEVFATLTQRQQDALQLARKAYDRLNDAKQEEDLGELK